MQIEVLNNPREVSSCLSLARDAFLGWRMQCARELALACQALDRLQAVLDEANADRPAACDERSRRAGGDCRDGQAPRTGSGEGRAVLDTGFHDASSQLLQHMQQRIIHAARLIENLDVPFSFAAAAAQDDRRAMRANCEDLESLWRGAAPKLAGERERRGVGVA